MQEPAPVYCSFIMYARLKGLHNVYRKVYKNYYTKRKLYLRIYMPESKYEVRLGPQLRQKALCRICGEKVTVQPISYKRMKHYYI